MISFHMYETLNLGSANQEAVTVDGFMDMILILNAG